MASVAESPTSITCRHTARALCKDEATFIRLLERLPDAERCETDAYGVYGALPGNKHMVGKYGAVNWNDELRSMLRGKLNGLVQRTKGCAKSVEMPVNLFASVSSEPNSMPLTIENTKLGLTISVAVLK